MLQFSWPVLYIAQYCSPLSSFSFQQTLSPYSKYITLQNKEPRRILFSLSFLSSLFSFWLLFRIFYTKSQTKKLPEIIKKVNKRLFLTIAVFQNNGLTSLSSSCVCLDSSAPTIQREGGLPTCLVWLFHLTRGKSLWSPHEWSTLTEIKINVWS